MILIEGLDPKQRHRLGTELRRRLPAWSYRAFPTVNQGTMTDVDYLAVVADAHPFMLLEPFHWTHWALAGTTYPSAWCGGNAQRLLELALLSRGAVVLLLLEDHAGKVCWAQQPGLTTASDEERATWRYLGLLGLPGLPSSRLGQRFIVDPRDLGNERYLCALASAAAEAASRAHELPAPTLGLGGPDAEFIVLGEGLPPHPPRVGADDRPTAPEFPLSQGPTGAEWGACVDRYSLRWERGYLTNASAFDGPEHLREFLPRLPHVSRVLCLGAEAGQLARDADLAVPAYQVNHPSHVRRFRHRERLRWQTEVATVLAPWCDRMDDALANTDVDDT